MDRDTLNGKSWYRAVKVLFIIAFISVQGIGVLIAHDIANDGEFHVHCDNGKTFPSPYYYSYMDSSEKLSIYKKCDLASFLLTKSEVAGSLTSEQVDDLKTRVSKMEKEGVLQSDIQDAVDDFKQIYASQEANSDGPITLTKEEFEAKYNLHDADDTFTTVSSGTFISNFTLQKEAKYTPIAQAAVYMGVFIAIGLVFWLLSRIFFYVVVKEDFIKLR